MRKGGNPDLREHCFKSDRDEPLNSNLCLKVSASLLADLRAIDGWQDKLRESAAKIVEGAIT